MNNDNLDHRFLSARFAAASFAMKELIIATHEAIAEGRQYPLVEDDAANYISSTEVENNGVPFVIIYATYPQNEAQRYIAMNLIKELKDAQMKLAEFNRVWGIDNDTEEIPF